MFPTQMRQYVFLLLAGIYLSVSQGQQTDNYHTVFAVNDSPLNKTPEFTKNTADIYTDYKLGREDIVASQSQLAPIYDWNRYYNLASGYEWMKQIHNKFNLGTNLVKIGTTHENRDIYAFYINRYKEVNIVPQSHNYTIVISAGVYGNEWITTATATYIINELLTSEDEDIKEISQLYDWVIVPFLNPDGYEFSFNTDRLWRKNRREPSQCCPGVDLNRSFHNRKNNSGLASNHSEPEVKALEKIFIMFNPIDLYISLETDNQMILYPLGFNETDAKKKKFIDTAQTAVEALAEVYGTKYRHGTLHNLYSEYPRGSSMDWAYETYGATAFTYKLSLGDHPADAIGGTVPVIKILPTAIETFHSVVAMVHKLQQMESDRWQKYYM